jgi:LemA protein
VLRPDGAAVQELPVPRQVVPFTSELRESETMRAMKMARPDTVRGARATWLRRAVTLLPLVLGACGYNTIQTLDETAAKSQKEIEVQLQRRADLIPNLVATVKGFAAQESSIFIAVANAQRGLTGALARPGGANPAELASANENLSRAILPMMTLVTSYPKLSSDAQFLKLQDELTGTENRVAVSRTDYNNAVNEYNAYIRKFPAVMTAKVLGSKPREYFEVTDAAKRAAPTVDFNAAPATTAPAAPPTAAPAAKP